MASTDAENGRNWISLKVVAAIVLLVAVRAPSVMREAGPVGLIGAVIGATVLVFAVKLLWVGLRDGRRRIAGSDSR